MVTPDDIERMCQQAIANGADPVELERVKAAAIREAGGTMAGLAYNMTFKLRLERLEEELGLRKPQEPDLATLQTVMAKYPDEAEKMLAALQKIREQRGEG